MTLVRRKFADGLPGVLLMAAVVALPTAIAAPGDVDPTVLEAEARRVEAIGRASATAVAIFAGAAGGGSGVLITSDGYALTNFHVVQPVGPAMRCGLNDGRLYDAVLVGLDPTGDVALVKLLGRDDFPLAEFADSDLVRPGDFCFAAGNPFLLATDLRPSISAGIVSGVHRYQFPAGTILEYTDCLQVDAAINPGNSGGGLFDAWGRLIGINGRASFEKRGRVNVGVGYAISAKQLLRFLGGLRGGRLCDHATLGASVSSSADGRVVVSDILEASDAWRRGLRYDDEIVSLAGRPVRTVNAFKNVLGTLPAGWQVPLSYRRGGRRLEMLVRLAAVHAPAELAAIVAGRDRRPGKSGAEPPGDPGGRRGDRSELDLPPAVKDLYHPRSGFANYHFNQIERDRVASRIAARMTGMPTPVEAWRCTGRVDQGGEFRLVVSDDEASIDLPTGTSRVSLDADLEGETAPPGSGGLLAALGLWRRLILEGPIRLGATTYWGQAPLIGLGFPGDPSQHEAPLYDVLESVVAGVTVRFFVDGAGHVSGIDLWTSPEADPCEVRLVPPASGDTGPFPAVMRVSRGTDAFATLTLESLEPDMVEPDMVEPSAAEVP
jgi:serine protease Do